MTSLGIWSCRWRELQPIAFGGHAGVGARGGAVDGGAGNAGERRDDGGGIKGLLAGRVWGRGGNGKDGAGVYELVSNKG